MYKRRHLYTQGQGGTRHKAIETRQSGAHRSTYSTHKTWDSTGKTGMTSVMIWETGQEGFHQVEARICKGDRLTEARPAEERTRRAGTSFRPPMAPFTVIPGGGKAARSKGETSRPNRSPQEVPRTNTTPHGCTRSAGVKQGACTTLLIGRGHEAGRKDQRRGREGLWLHPSQGQAQTTSLGNTKRARHDRDRPTAHDHAAVRFIPRSVEGLSGNWSGSKLGSIKVNLNFGWVKTSKPILSCAARPHTRQTERAPHTECIGGTEPAPGRLAVEGAAQVRRAATDPEVLPSAYPPSEGFVDYLGHILVILSSMTIVSRYFPLPNLSGIRLRPALRGFING